MSDTRLGVSDDAALARAKELAAAWCRAHAIYPNGELAADLVKTLRTYGDERERAVAPTHCNICMYDPCACLALDERGAEQRERDAKIAAELYGNDLAWHVFFHQAGHNIAAAIRASHE